MKNYISTIAFLLATGTAQAQNATIQVSERNCSDNNLSQLFQGQSRWTIVSGETISNSSRSNLADNKCDSSDISIWVTELQNNCATYFDVITITPITKGASTAFYHNGITTSQDDARAGGLGYSYTDRLVMTYRCL